MRESFCYDFPIFPLEIWLRSELQGYGEALDRQALAAGNAKNGTVTHSANGQPLNL